MLKNLQVLRALAALLVVLVHVGGMEALHLRDALIFGHAGVDLFFVISGFVMVYSVSRKPVSASSFLINRIIRVVPLYWLFTIALYASAIVGHRIMQPVEPTFVQFVKSLMFVPFEYSDGRLQPIYFLGWTLNYEMSFYLLFTAAIAMAGRSVARTVAIAVATIVVAALVGLVLQPQSVLGRFYTDPIILEFGLGMLIAMVFVRDVTVPPLFSWLAIAIGGAGLVVFPLLGFGAHGLVQIPLAALVIAGAVFIERAGASITNRFILLCGAASYSLYLSHPFAVAVGDRLVPHLPAAAIVPVALLFCLCGAVVLSIVLHLFIEHPITEALRRLSGHRPSIVARREDEMLAAVASTGLSSSEGGDKRPA